MGNQKLPGWDALVPERGGASERPLDFASPALFDPVVPMPEAHGPQQPPVQISDPVTAASEKVSV
jgi:hypothetical protein